MLWEKKRFQIYFFHLFSDLLDERKRRLIGEEFYNPGSSNGGNGVAANGPSSAVVVSLPSVDLGPSSSVPPPPSTSSSSVAAAVSAAVSVAVASTDQETYGIKKEDDEQQQQANGEFIYIFFQIVSWQSIQGVCISFHLLIVSQFFPSPTRRLASP